MCPDFLCRNSGVRAYGYKIGDGEIGLAAYAGDDGYLGGVDSLRPLLIVEGPQLLQ